MASRPLTRAEWMAALAEAVDNFDWSGNGKRQWQGLTDEETDELVRRFSRYELLRAIETKLREKNT